MKKILVVLLALMIITTLISCQNNFTADKISYALEISPDVSNYNFNDSLYNNAYLKFSTELLKKVNEDKNIVLSPLSVYIALSMLANGAEDESLEELTEVLGLSLEELNYFCYYLVSKLTTRKEAKLDIANSFWIDKESNINVKKDFLDVNAIYYGIDVYRDNFSSKKAVDNINYWVKENTKGMIKKMFDEIAPETFLILINTIFFESKWLNPDYNYTKKTFTDAKGKETNTDFFGGSSGAYYYSDDAKAFRVPLKDDFYFLGILPNENDIDAYLEKLDGNELNKLLINKNISCDVYWSIPKFSYDYEKNLIETLELMGLKDIFSPQNAKLKKVADISQNIFVNDVTHKARIELDKNGVKAAAATAVSCAPTSCEPKDIIYLYLNRPFVYSIMDGKTNIPIFLGVVKYL